ncbi:MAG: SMP-30/gluconolactonase/LRE family protein, partial [Bacteroidota bacterium]
KRHVQDPHFLGDMVEYADKLMGKIMANLEEAGIAEQTLVIFYSDNGTQQGLSSQVGTKTVMGGKGLNIDAGTRVPLIVNWKGQIKAGGVSDEMIAPSDFFPTIFEAIKRPLSPRIQTDGESFFPHLFGKEKKRRDWVFIDHNPRPGWDKQQFIPTRFVKGDRYKLYASGKFYDLSNDELEQHPISPEKLAPGVRQLHNQYEHILDSLRRYPTMGSLEVLDPAFHKVVPPGTKIEVIADGFTWSEGPVWVPEQQCLLVSDVPRNIVYKWTEANGLEKYLKPSGYTGKKLRRGGMGSNGLALDPNGRLLLCRAGDREVARLIGSLNDPHPLYQPLATHFEGKRINSPNDLTVDRAGNIYFTDPDNGMDKDLLPESRELPFKGVYRLSKEGELSLLTSSLELPNGIHLSPDEKTLYVANSIPPKWIAFDLSESGEVSNERVFFDGQKLVDASVSKQKPDGLKTDNEGNLFATGPDGVLIFSPEGKHLGTIKTNKKTSNCAFNEDKTVLYVTCHQLILRVVLGYKTAHLDH